MKEEKLKSRRLCDFKRYGYTQAVRYLKTFLKEKQRFKHFDSKILSCNIYYLGDDIYFPHHNDITFRIDGFGNNRANYNKFSYDFYSKVIIESRWDNQIELDELKEFVSFLQTKLEEFFKTKNTCQNCIHRFNYDLIGTCGEKYTRRVYKSKKCPF